MNYHCSFGTQFCWSAVVCSCYKKSNKLSSSTQGCIT